MDIRKLIEYTIWADGIYIEYTQSLSPDDYAKQIPGYDNSISNIMKHMCDAYWSWFHTITDQDYSDEPDWDVLTRTDCIQMIRDSHENIMHYIDNEDLTRPIKLQWHESHKPVTTTAENIIFNFVTHQAYHRGQIAIFLRHLGLNEIEETDFNPYIYGLQQDN